MTAAIAWLVAHDGWDGHMSWDGGWWLMMLLGMVLFWGLVILGAVLVVRELVGRRDERRRDRSSDAMAVLDRRLAEGEISTEEYRERRAVLRGE